MRTGLFNLLRISPTPVDGDSLRLDIAAEEAKSKQLGLLVGYGTFEGPIGGIEFRRSTTFSAPVVR